MSASGPIDYYKDDLCPDDVVPKLTRELIDAVTYHLFTCMDDVEYNQIRDAVESFISLINTEATQNNKARIVQKVAKAANKMIVLQKQGKLDEAFETTQKLMNESKADWHTALTRETRKRRLSGSFSIATKRPHTAMSENGNSEIVSHLIGSDTMSTGHNSEIDDQSEAGFSCKLETLTSEQFPVDLPDWPTSMSPWKAVEIIDRLYFGFCLRKKSIFGTLELLREINPTHILLYCTDKRNLVAASYKELQGRIVKKIFHNDGEDDVDKLKQTLQFIHLARFQDQNTVVAVCCDSACFSLSGFVIASYIQAFLGHRIDWGLRAIKGYHSDFALRPDDVLRFEEFLEVLSSEILKGLEEQVGDTNDVKECDIQLYLQGIDKYTKWSNTVKNLTYDIGYEYESWKIMMNQLSQLDYFHRKPVHSIPSKTIFTQPTGFAQVTANAKLEQYQQSDAL